MVEHLGCPTTKGFFGDIYLLCLTPWTQSAFLGTSNQQIGSATEAASASDSVPRASQTPAEAGAGQRVVAGVAGKWPINESFFRGKRSVMSEFSIANQGNQVFFCTIETY